MKVQCTFVCYLYTLFSFLSFYNYLMYIFMVHCVGPLIKNKKDWDFFEWFNPVTCMWLSPWLLSGTLSLVALCQISYIFLKIFWLIFLDIVSYKWKKYYSICFLKNKGYRIPVSGGSRGRVGTSPFFEDQCIWMGTYSWKRGRTGVRETGGRRKERKSGRKEKKIK